MIVVVTTKEKVSDASPLVTPPLVTPFILYQLCFGTIFLQLPNHCSADFDPRRNCGHLQTYSLLNWLLDPQHYFHSAYIQYIQYLKYDDWNPGIPKECIFYYYIQNALIKFRIPKLSVRVVLSCVFKIAVTNVLRVRKRRQYSIYLDLRHRLPVAALLLSNKARKQRPPARHTGIIVVRDVVDSTLDSTLPYLVTCLDCSPDRE